MAAENEADRTSACIQIIVKINYRNIITKRQHFIVKCCQKEFYTILFHIATLIFIFISFLAG